MDTKYELYCCLCIFMKDGNVYGYFKTNKLIGLYEYNYGDTHEIRFIGSKTKEEIKSMYPHASFIDFNQLGKNRIEKIKIIELNAPYSIS